MKKLTSLLFFCVCFINIYATSSDSLHQHGPWFRVFFFEDGTQLHFLNITNHSSETIALHGDFSISGSVVLRNNINRKHLVASRYFLKQHISKVYQEKKGIMMLLGGLSVISTFPLFFGIGDTIQHKASKYKDANSFLGALFGSGVCGVLGGILMNRYISKEGKEEQGMIEAIDSCNFWLEVPNTLIRPNESITFALLAFGNYEVKIFNDKFDQIDQTLMGRLF